MTNRKQHVIIKPSKERKYKTMTTRTYDYINGLGRQKRLEVNMEKTADNKYWNVIWDMATGEFCGDAESTAEELNELLNNYGLEFVEAE